MQTKTYNLFHGLTQSQKDLLKYLAEIPVKKGIKVDALKARNIVQVEFFEACLSELIKKQFAKQITHTNKDTGYKADYICINELIRQRVKDGI